MESRTLPEAVKSIMKVHGWSQSQLARELGVPRDWISKIKRGDRDPSIGRLSQLLAGIGWEVIIRPKREKAPVKRREFVAAAASVMFVPSPKVGPYEDPTHVHEMAQRLAQARYEHGGGTIAATAMKHIRHIEPVVAGGDKKLQAAASDLAVESVWTLSDAHRFDAGENVGRLALELAKRSESPDAQSRAYSALAQLNSEWGRADRAFKYAKSGVQLPEVPETQQAWMRLRRARTLTLVRGQENAARDEIESVYGPLRDRGFPGQSSFDVADMMACIGVALNRIGVYADAHCMLNEALALLGDSSPNPQSQRLAQQVLAALRMSQPALAADHMLALARIAPLVNSRWLDGDLREVLAESAKWASVPEIRDARDHLRTVVQAPAPPIKRT
ncbi:MAG TPA: helix-turn-helix transcriptional regulator [Streptosporangiaceae bacterium]|jgi:transcriptional regulator with XRE-family HTH domain|nr:helix-turn-helix transcriptional regulator [Streptosporangiaceae bacterium]